MISVLQSLGVNGGPTPVLTKRFTPSGVASYDNAYLFDVHEVEVGSIDDLSELLTSIEDISGACIVRGKLKPGVSPQSVRRLCSVSRDDATFEEQHQPWMLCDFDKVPAPNLDMTNAERLDYLVSLLPPYFHGASYHYRWSASAGVQGWGYLSCHLWFWLSEAWDSATIRERMMEEQWECDESPFDPVHVHYTAAPIFDGVENPMPEGRSGLIRGDRDAVVMPPFMKPVFVPSQHRHERKIISGEAGFEARLSEIGPRFHTPIRRAIAYYCRVNQNVDTFELRERIKDAIHAAPPGRSNKNDYLDNHYIDDLLPDLLPVFRPPIN